MSECVTNLRCPVCGAYLCAEDKRPTCKICMSVYDDCDRLSDHLPAYNAALNERMKLEFKNSEIFYNHILDEDFELAKPHFCLLLAEFGTQLQIGADGKLNYIVHNACANSVFDSANYKNAIRFAPVKEKASFVEKALKIEDARKTALKGVELPSEYDVFLCQKCVKSDGNHTREYDYGYGLAEILKTNGYNVYFADHDFGDAVSDACLPAALAKSRSMIVISSSKQNADDIALKQLWGRYLYLIENSFRRNDSLIPVSLTFDESSFPARLRKLHCLKVVEAGCEQKLLRRLNDVLSLTQADEAELRFMKSSVKAVVFSGSYGTQADDIQDSSEVPAGSAAFTRTALRHTERPVASAQRTNTNAAYAEHETTVCESRSKNVDGENAKAESVSETSTDFPREKENCGKEQANTGGTSCDNALRENQDYPAAQSTETGAPAGDTREKTQDSDTEQADGNVKADNPAQQKIRQAQEQTDEAPESPSADQSQPRADRQCDSNPTVSSTLDSKNGSRLSDSPQSGADANSQTMLIEDGVLKEYSGTQTTVRIPEHVVAIAEKAFYNDRFLEKLVLHETFTDIGDGAFSFCPKLQEIDFGGTKRVGKRAFFGCSALTHIRLGEDVETLSDAAFGECQNVKTLSVGKSLKTLGMRVFAGCTNLEKIKVSPLNPHLKCVDDSLVSTDVKTLFLSPAVRRKKTYRLPTTIEKIHNAAFYGSNLERIAMFSSLVSIGDSAFTASRIRTISLPQDVRTLGSRAFERCKFLESAHIPKRVKVLESYTFCGCESLEKVTMENVEYIRENAFESCGNLVSVSFSQNLKSIGAKAFLKCKKLKKPNLPQGIETVDKTAFES